VICNVAAFVHGGEVKKPSVRRPEFPKLTTLCYNSSMTLDQLEKTISELPPDQLSKFREWFLAFDAEKWDEQFEADVVAGRLDRLADDAIGEHRAGKSTRI